MQLVGLVVAVALILVIYPNTADPTDDAVDPQKASALNGSTRPATATPA